MFTGRMFELLGIGFTPGQAFSIEVSTMKHYINVRYLTGGMIAETRRQFLLYYLSASPRVQFHDNHAPTAIDSMYCRVWTRLPLGSRAVRAYPVVTYGELTEHS